MADFRKLEVWQKAHKLTIKIYVLTKELPREETYGLTSQIRRAAVSVESNIAEGEGRYHKADRLKFFVDSRSSIKEVQTQLLIIGDIYSKLKNESDSMFNEYDVLARQLSSLISYRRNYAN